MVMIKVYAGIASVGFLVLLSGAGCSSANTPDDEDATAGKGGTGALPSGGSTGTSGTSTTSAGTGNATAGETSSTGGSGTAGTGTGTAGSGTAGAPNAACKGIKSNMACTPEGTDCPGLACGLADSGKRSCKCATTWMCAACDFTGTQFEKKPTDLTKCTGVEADKIKCTEMGKVCEGAPGGEVCACWTDDEGSLIWDCDKPPTSWAMTTM
jgi:hypothetical protein